MSETPLLDQIRAEAQRQAAALQPTGHGARVTAFLVQDADGVSLGVGALIGDDVALTAALRDSVKDGRLRPHAFRVDLTIGGRS